MATYCNDSQWIYSSFNGFMEFVASQSIGTVDEPSNTVSSMKPKAATSIVLGALTITGGRIVQDREPLYTDKMIVGGMFVVLGISVANAYSPPFADVFAFLLLIVAFLIYGMDLMTSIGFQVRE